MNLKKERVEVGGWRLSLVKDGGEVGRVFLYLLENDLHDEPYGFVEDLFVKKDYRRQGLGTKLMKEVMKLAKEEGCYKLVFTSRYGRDGLHEFYEELGFENYGKEFRMDL